MNFILSIIGAVLSLAIFLAACMVLTIMPTPVWIAIGCAFWGIVIATAFVK